MYDCRLNQLYSTRGSRVDPTTGKYQQIPNLQRRRRPTTAHNGKIWHPSETVSGWEFLDEATTTSVRWTEAENRSLMSFTVFVKWRNRTLKSPATIASSIEHNLDEAFKYFSMARLGVFDFNLAARPELFSKCSQITLVSNSLCWRIDAYCLSVVFPISARTRASA